MRQLAFVIILLGLVACGTPADTAATTEAPPPSADSPAATVPETTDASAEPAATDGAGKPDSYYVGKVVELTTDLGTIAIRFFPDVAPAHVRNFIDLSESGFYTGTKFHRIIPGFVIQGGDPNTREGDPSTWGQGGSGKRLTAEFSTIRHTRGILSMARAQDPDSASSQFFICVADANALDNQYTVFGEVVSGMDVVDKIVGGQRTGPRNDQAVQPVEVKGATVRDATDAEKAPTPK